MATSLQIKNMALRLLGVARIAQTDLDNETNEHSRILNDIYELVRDEVLAVHPWNFAIKRAELTELGGTVTGWTEEGTANVWEAALTTEPSYVNFDGIEGEEQTSVAACNAERYWYWESDVLYVYSTSDPDDAYTSIDAVIPEFDFSYAFSLPDDCLRVIKMEDDDAEFVKEGDRLFTNSDEAKIQYIAQITDETEYPPAFVSAFATRLAMEMAFPLSNSADLVTAMTKLFFEKLRFAKAIDAQEGSGQRIDERSWEEARE